ncbi:MAG: hypothetical protein WCJ98_10875 [Mycobacteriaceae bacterium]
MNDHGARHQPVFYLWLAAGAVTFGVGAALAGPGVAHADTEITRPSHRTAEKPPGHSARVTTVRAAHARTNVAKSATARSATAAMPFPDQLRRGFQQALNGLVPIVNNTPIRYVLDAIDRPSSQPGSTAVRLFGVPGGSVLSPDGTRMFQVTSAGYSGFPFQLIPPAFHSVTEIDTATNTVIGVPVVVDGAPVGAPVVSSLANRAYQTSYGVDPATGSTVTYVTTINTVDDTIVGTPVQISGGPGAARIVLSPDGSRAFQTTLGAGITTLTTIDTVRGIAVGTPLTMPGTPVAGLVMSADGTRLYQTTNLGSPYTAVVTVIDAANSNIIGQPIAIDGSPNAGVVLSPDGARAVQATNRDNVTAVTFINSTDATVARTVVVAGITYYGGSLATAPMFSDSGARISQITMAQDPVSGTYTTLLTIIDTSTGAIVGTPVILPAANTNQLMAGVPDPAGSRVVIASDIENPATKTLDSTVVTVIDSTDGSIIGSPVTLSGYAKGTPVGTDGLRVVQTTQCCVLQYTPNTVISTLGADGFLIGSPVTLAGEPLGPVVVSADGSRAYQTMMVYPTGTNRVYSTLVAAIDTTTGGLVGTPVTVSGDPYISVLLTPDGRRAFETTFTENWLLHWFFPTLVTRLDTTKFSALP